MNTPVLESAQDIIDYLLSAAEGNYTFTGKYLGRNYRNVFTENYYYSELAYPFTGAVLLDNIDKSSSQEKVLYSFEVDGDDILLGNAMVQSVFPSTIYMDDINSNFNTLSLLNEKYTADLLTPDGYGSFTVENDPNDTNKVTLLGILGYVLGYDTSILGYVTGATLTGLYDGSLEIQFNAPLSSGLSSDDLYGVISDVGTSSVDALESLIASKPFDNGTLSDSSVDVLKRTEGSINTSVDIVSIDPASGAEERVDFGSFLINFDSDHFYSVMEQDGSASYDNYIRNNGEQQNIAQGNAYSAKINGNNEKVIIDAQEGYDSAVGDRGVSQLPEILSSSYKVDEDTYVYHGADADNYLVYLTGLSMASVSNLTFHLEDGQVNEITARYGQGDLLGVTYYFDVDITFGDYEKFVEPEPFESEANEGDYETIKNAIDYFNSQTEFSFTYYDEEDRQADPEKYDRTQVIVDSDTILTIDYHQGAELISGRRQNEDGTISRFEVTTDANGNYTARETYKPEQGELEEGYEITLNPYVLTLADESTAVTRPYVIDLAPYILTDSTSDFMDPSTFTMTLDKEDHLTTYSYYYDLLGILTGTRVYEFDYGDDAGIPADIQNAIDNMEKWEEPLTWANCPSAYNSLVTIFGKEIADSLPFLFVEGVTEGNVLTGMGMQGMDDIPSYVYVSTYNEEIGPSFVNAYVAYLESDYADEYVKTLNEDGTYSYVGKDVTIIPNPGPDPSWGSGIYFYETL